MADKPVPLTKEGLAKLQEELRSTTYRPLPLLRVWIPKSNGGQRPLGIPAIRDRGYMSEWDAIFSPLRWTSTIVSSPPNRSQDSACGCDAEKRTA